MTLNKIIASNTHFYVVIRFVRRYIRRYMLSFDFPNNIVLFNTMRLCIESSEFCSVSCITPTRVLRSRVDMQAMSFAPLARGSSSSDAQYSKWYTRLLMRIFRFNPSTRSIILGVGCQVKRLSFLGNFLTLRELRTI